LTYPYMDLVEIFFNAKENGILIDNEGKIKNYIG